MYTVFFSHKNEIFSVSLLENMFSLKRKVVIRINKNLITQWQPTLMCSKIWNIAWILFLL